jgi:toxin ParE1/3/4
MKVIWGHRAKRDLVELIAYIAENNSHAADRVAARILRSAQLLSRFPRSGRTGRVSGTRERVVRRTPYILVYQIASARVRILRVYHGARMWPEIF